jgi:hypothetical protein
MQTQGNWAPTSRPIKQSVALSEKDWLIERDNELTKKQAGVNIAIKENQRCYDELDALNQRLNEVQSSRENTREIGKKQCNWAKS